jgi:hypothetical protein
LARDVRRRAERALNLFGQLFAPALGHSREIERRELIAEALLRRRIERETKRQRAIVGGFIKLCVNPSALL